MKTNYIKLILIYLSLIASTIVCAESSHIDSWNSTATYTAGKVVTYNNQTYLALSNIAKNTTPGANPTKWQLIGTNLTGAQDFKESQKSQGQTIAANPSPKAGDACTLPNSPFVNTGVVTARTLSNGPVVGQTSYLLCENPKVWNFQEDMKVGIKSSSSYRDWTLMSLTPGNYDTSTFVQLTSKYDCMAPPPGALVTTFLCWSSTGTADGVIGLFEAAELPVPLGQGIPARNPQETIVLLSDAGTGNAIKWTSPFAGDISINASISPFPPTPNYPYSQPPTPSYTAIFKNTTPLVQNTDTYYRFPVSTSVNIGDEIYFIFDIQSVPILHSLDLVITKQ